MLLTSKGAVREVLDPCFIFNVEFLGIFQYKIMNLYSSVLFTVQSLDYLAFVERCHCGEVLRGE